MKRLLVVGLLLGTLLGCATTKDLTPEERERRAAAYWDSVQRTKEILFAPTPIYRTRTSIRIYRIR